MGWNTTSYVACRRSGFTRKIVLSPPPLDLREHRILSDRLICAICIRPVTSCRNERANNGSEFNFFSVRNKIFDSVEVRGAELWEPPGSWTNLKMILFLSTLQLYSKRTVTRVVQVLRTDLIWIQLRTLRAWLKCGGVNYCIRFSYIFLHDNEIMIVVVNA